MPHVGEYTCPMDCMGNMKRHAVDGSGIRRSPPGMVNDAFISSHDDGFWSS